MYRTLLLTSFLFSILQVGFSQVVFHDLGEGKAIAINSNYGLDIDDNGSIDFHINSKSNELGFTPILDRSCFTSDIKNDRTSWGAMKLSIHEEGEVIGIRYENMETYIENESAGLHNIVHGTAKNWTDDEPQYIGYAVFLETGRLLNGWMKIKLDLQKNELIILEYAYLEVADINDEGIQVGFKGSVSNDNLSEVLSSVTVSPNPAIDFFRLDFTYTDSAQLEVLVSNSVGKVIATRQVSNATSSLTMDSSDWAAGFYTISFRSKEGSYTERIQITK